MTESQWTTSADPERMLECLDREANERGLRLFMAACCRRIWHLVREPNCCDSVVVAERFAEGEVRSSKLADACEMANLMWADDDEAEGSRDARAAATYPPDPDPYAAAFECISAATSAVAGEDDVAPDAVEKERAAQAVILRCVFPWPEREPTRFGAALLAWNDGIVRRLADAIYDEKAFDHLPILGDALEEAGCTDAGLLAHLRSSEPHVRGCWALDLILGKR